MGTLLDSCAIKNVIELSGNDKELFTPSTTDANFLYWPCSGIENSDLRPFRHLAGFRFGDEGIYLG